MKSLTLITILSAMGTSLMAQPVFETIINESANICQLESIGNVYSDLLIPSQRISKLGFSYRRHKMS